MRRLLPGGVIGNTRDFGSLVPGSSPGRVAAPWARFVRQASQRVHSFGSVGLTPAGPPARLPGSLGSATLHTRGGSQAVFLHFSPGLAEAKV